MKSRITVVTERAEVAGRDPFLRSNFDYAIARAVASANVVAEYLVPFLNSTGQALIFKAGWGQPDQQKLKKVYW